MQPPLHIAYGAPLPYVTGAEGKFGASLEPCTGSTYQLSQDRFAAASNEAVPCQLMPVGPPPHHSLPIIPVRRALPAKVSGVAQGAVGGGDGSDGLWTLGWCEGCGGSGSGDSDGGGGGRGDGGGGGGGGGRGRGGSASRASVGGGDADEDGQRRRYVSGPARHLYLLLLLSYL